MQATTGSVGGRVVDWEVRKEVVVLELGEVMPLRVKVDLLGGLGVSFYLWRWETGEGK